MITCIYLRVKVLLKTFMISYIIIYSSLKGTSVVIIRGSRFNCITDVMNGMDVGTFFTLEEKNEAENQLDIREETIKQIATKGNMRI